MSRHTAYRFNLTHKAILATVLGFGTINAQAISLGQPAIQSGQNEPLSATIDISGIDANQFEASIASNTIYAQMGLTQSADINVQFVRTSESSGKLILTSTKPITTPFADIVLNLHNKDEQIIEAQTLLMPMSHGGDNPEYDTPIIAQDDHQDLPIASGHESLEEDNAFVIPEPASIQMPIQTDGQSPYAPMLAEHNTDKALSGKAPRGTNNQLEILTGEITRKIYPKGMAPTSPSSEHDLPMSIALPDDAMDEHELAKKSKTKQPKRLQDNDDHPENSGATYVVQSGDTLWSIARQIAKANNLSIDSVMTALHEQNPDAFDGGKMNRLKANVALSIPAYDVIPSQKAIQEAISAKRSGNSKAKTARTTNTKVSANKKPTRPKTVTKPLPRPQVTLVTPSQSGTSTGSDVVKASKPTPNQPTSVAVGGDDQLINTLKNTRSQTAQTAQRVNGLNQELSTASHKLQLQNQKLAELEARLKALKDKQ